MRKLLVLMLLSVAAVAQVAVTPIVNPVQQFLDASGNPLAGGKIYFYTAGTTTPKATYSEATGTSANANPVILNSAGRATIFLQNSAYKIVAKDSSDVTQWTVDNVSPLASLTASEAFTGSVTMGLLNSVRYVDGVKFATIADAAASCGSTAACHVVIPSTYAGTECPAVSTNISYDDFRAGGRSGSGTSSFICTTNVVQYNSYTPGFTDAMLRSEMKRTSVHSDGSIVSLYPITHLSNATVSGTGTTVDGAAPEAQIEGTLSGTLPYVHGTENTASIFSTGGTVSNASGAIGLVFSSVGSTTAVTNAYGLWGRGCQGTIAGAAPTNCYGGFFSRQLAAASGRNYAAGIEGKGLLLYDSNVGAGGLDAEDASAAAKPFLYVASDNSANVQAVNATGLYFRDSTGAEKLRVDSSGAHFGLSATALSFFTKATHATLDLASVASGACSAQNTETITGVALGDSCTVAASTELEDGAWFRCAATATNTVKWSLCNLSGVAVDRASDTYTIRDLR
jgi:hypothetical protein